MKLLHQAEAGYEVHPLRGLLGPAMFVQSSWAWIAAELLCARKLGAPDNTPDFLVLAYRPAQDLWAWPAI